MANKNLSVEMDQARKLYMQGVTSAVHLSQIVGVNRQTIGRWIETQGWEGLREKTNVTPMEIALQITSILQTMLEQMKEIQADGNPASAQDLKAMISYVRALRQLDEDYDIRGSLVTWSNKLINFLSSVPSDVIPNRKEFVKTLQTVMMLFLKSQENA